MPPSSVLEALPKSQAGEGRHQCAVCAYEQGREDARAGKPTVESPHGSRCSHGSVVPLDLFDRLHPNQGSIGRHTCVWCAYVEGFDTYDG